MPISAPQAVSPPSVKHVFIAFVKSDIGDTQAYDELKAALLQREIRVFQDDPSDNLNDVIAKGVENAAVVVVLSSPAMQTSMQGPKKILNYADTRKTPLINITSDDEYQPTDWLGTILANAREAENVDTLLAVMQELLPGEKMDEIRLAKGEVGLVVQSKPLFLGGSANKSVKKASMFRNGIKTDMVLDKLQLQLGRLEGQGRDPTGEFTVTGDYPPSSNYGDVSFKKTYKNGNTALYEGSFHIRENSIRLAGRIEQQTTDTFEIELSLASAKDDNDDNEDADRSNSLLRPTTTKRDKTVKARTMWTKVVLAYAESQKSDAERVAAGLRVLGVKDVVVPGSCAADTMIKIASSQAAVVVALMSHAYQGNEDCKRFLTYASKADIPIIPLRADFGDAKFEQSGWLGVIVAGDLWFDVVKDFDGNLKLAKDNINAALTKRGKGVDSVGGARMDGVGAKGSYSEGGKQVDMDFSLFTMVNGSVAGQGSDVGKDFVLSGTYDELDDDEDNFKVKFIKSYIDSNSLPIQYYGTTTSTDTSFILKGAYWIAEDDESNTEPEEEPIPNVASKANAATSSNDDDNESEGDSEDDSDDDSNEEDERHFQEASAAFQTFTMEIKRKQHEEKAHVMLSYNWNSQPLVKKFAEELKKREIPHWLDVNGDMKGNINSSMADGVEGSRVFLSFITTTYCKSLNCQKEFSYASQLDKTILPVLLEDPTKFDDTWLQPAIADSQQNESIFVVPEGAKELSDEQVANLCDLLNELWIEAWGEDDDEERDVETLFEGASVAGQYLQAGTSYPMTFDFFSLRDGYVFGQGQDRVGVFTVSGTYESDGAMEMTKSYVGAHKVGYEGNVTSDTPGTFHIEGRWNLDGMTDLFTVDGDMKNAAPPRVTTVFEDGTVEGESRENGILGKKSNMAFDLFTMVAGRVLGNGQDEGGNFSVMGSYEQDGSVQFEKTYSADNVFKYVGTYKAEEEGSFKMDGAWTHPRKSGKFHLEGTPDYDEDDEGDDGDEEDEDEELGTEEGEEGEEGQKGGVAAKAPADNNVTVKAAAQASLQQPGSSNVVRNAEFETSGSSSSKPNARAVETVDVTCETRLSNMFKSFFKK